MADARTVGENGVAVYQTMNSSLGAFYRPVFDDDGCFRAPQSHVAFPKDEARLMQAVVIAVDKFAGEWDAPGGTSSSRARARVAMFAALDDLAQATIYAKDGGPDAI